MTREGESEGHGQSTGRGQLGNRGESEGHSQSEGHGQSGGHSQSDGHGQSRDRGQSGTDALAAFSCLGNETRLSILRALYDTSRHYDGPGQREVPYSELQEESGVADSGKFNYHLKKLTEHFVSKTDGGYILNQRGRWIAQLVVGSFGLPDVTFGPTETDADCPRCGGTVAISYGNEHLTTQCLDCSGLVRTPRIPEGTLSTLVFPPAGVTDRPREDFLDAVHRRFEFHCASMTTGLCPTCGGVVERDLLVCDDHDETEPICDDCGAAFPAVTSLSCRYCGLGRLAPVPFTRTDSPVIAAALEAADATDGSWDRFSEIVTWPCTVHDDGDETRVEFDPPAVAGSFVVDEDLRVTLPAENDWVGDRAWNDGRVAGTRTWRHPP
jgi:DNA-binding transcriptional ArsR family regulator